MPATLDDWSDQYWTQSFSRHTAQVDTSKVLVTFAAGLAGALVGTALQVEPQGPLDTLAVIVLAIAALLAVLTVFLDRLAWPDRSQILVRQHNRGWSDAETLNYITDLHTDLEAYNKVIVRWVRSAARHQVLASLVAAALAVLSLFQ